MIEDSSYSAAYYATRESWLDWRIEANALVRLARLDRPARILEVGCGSGGLLKILDHPGILAIGVDTQLSALEWARRRPDLGQNAQVAQIGTGGALPFSTDSFDSILAQHVIEHIPDLASTLREWTRVLKPGGRLALATPNALYPDPSHFDDIDHVSIFGPSELCSNVERSGFIVDSLVTVFPYLTHFRPLRAAGVRAFRLFQHLPYFHVRGRTLLLSASVAK